MNCGITGPSIKNSSTRPNAMRKIIFFLTCVLLFLAPDYHLLIGRDCPGPGLKYFQNYNPHKEHDFQPQNWAILQDRRGLIYIGNHGGLLEFDGVSWRLIPVPNRSVRSLAMAEEGTIYIGGENEFGFLAPGPDHSLHYASLTGYLENTYKQFSNIYSTYINREGVYFMSPRYLFRWSPGSTHINVWEPSYRFRTSFMCNNTLFIHQEKVGLMQIKNDALVLAPGGEAFAGTKVDMLVPFDSRNLLVGSWSDGFFLYDGVTLKPFPTEADSYLAEKQIYHGIRLTHSPGEFAVASRLGGLVIIDSRGRVKYTFNKSSGLHDENVKYVFEDSDGNIWLALNKGISRLEYASPLSVYDDGMDLPGIALSVCIVEKEDCGVLYAGTTDGLYRLDTTGHFRLEPGLTGICWSLLSLENGLLAAFNDGVYQVDTGNSTAPTQTRRLLDISATVLYRSPTDPRRIWAGTANGLVSLYANPDHQNPNGDWMPETKFENITEAVKTIAEDPKGNLWLGTSNRGVIRVDFPTPGVTPYILTYYSSPQGLPDGGVNVFSAAGHIIFTTESGIYRFDESTKRMIPDTTLGETYTGGGAPVFRMAEDQHKTIWFHSQCRNYRAVLTSDGTSDIQSQPFLRIPLAQVNSIYPDPDGEIVWFAGVDGLVRFDTRIKKNYGREYSTYIRKVIVKGIPPVYGGIAGRKPGDTSDPDNAILETRQRNIGFQFAAAFFEKEADTRYQSMLEGYDDNWSEWSPETRKDYTNLDPGIYTFRVRARNGYNQISREDRYPFRVLTPWHRQWWAYGFYLLMIALGIYGVVKWRSWKLHREKQRLEQVVRERTHEITEKNRQLEEQATQLEGQTRQLREQSQRLAELDGVKSRFFAQISHEFRTPLTLIMGPLEHILSRGESPPEYEKDIRLALQHAHRLLELINRLLNLAKLDSKVLELPMDRRDISPVISDIADSFETPEEMEEMAEMAEIPGRDDISTVEKPIILVVDDQADMRHYIRDGLEPDYHVIEAGDGRRGVDKAKEIIPDLVISDVMMPGMDGFELCRILKRSLETSHIPVILLTARASEESVIHGLETGADVYITKPFSTGILNARIKNLIELRRKLHLDINREMIFQPAKVSLPEIDKEFLKETNRLIEKHLTDPDFNVEGLREKMIISRATLYRKILALTGETPALYIQSLRLKRAAQLLKSNFGSVTEVAFEVGFSSRAYFTKCFKEKFKRLPSEYSDSAEE